MPISLLRGNRIILSGRLTKKMAKAAQEFTLWSDEDIDSIRRQWAKGHQTPAAIRDACGFNIELPKIKSKLQQLQRGESPVLVKGGQTGK